MNRRDKNLFEKSAPTEDDKRGGRKLMISSKRRVGN